MSRVPIRSLPILLVLLGVVAGCGRSDSTPATPRPSATATTKPGEIAVAKRTTPTDDEVVPGIADDDDPPPAIADDDNESGPKDITFDHIKFDLEKDEQFQRDMLPKKIEDLIGQKIRIRGFIFPNERQKMKTFVVMRDNQECCFGPGAALYDCVRVQMKGDAEVDYTLRPIAVEGTFSLRIFRFPDGRQSSIYFLEGERVR